MTQRVGQGGTITLDVVFSDGAGTLVDPVAPRVDIINPAAVQVVTDAVPVTDGVGLYHYDYAVDGAAPLGVWTAHWTGTINGVLVGGDDAFEVVAAGEAGFPPGDSLATLEELEARIPGGIPTADEARAQAALDDASVLIRAAAGTDWAGSTPPAVAKMVCLSAARRSFINPDAVRSQQLDGYGVTFSSSSPDVYLTKEERRLIRGSVGKSGLGVISTTRLAEGERDTSTVFLDVEPEGEPIPWDVAEPS